MNVGEPYITYVKIGAAIVALGVVGVAGFHFGGLSADDKLANYKTEVQAQYAANLKTVADTLNSQIKEGAVKRAAMQVIIDAYDLEKAKPPVTAGIVQRMHNAESASCTAGHQLPAGGSVASGAQEASGVSVGLSEGERLLQDALDAAARDAARLDTVVKLAP